MSIRVWEVTGGYEDYVVRDRVSFRLGTIGEGESTTLSGLQRHIESGHRVCMGLTGLHPFSPS